MRVYFLAEKLCTLAVNGLYLGTVDGFERTAELDPADGCVLECKPMSGYHAVRFRFDEEFLLSPPPQVKLYYTRGGVAVYCFNFLREDAAMRIVRQVRLESTRLTLYVQGKVQLSVENETGFHLVDLPDAMEDAEISASGNCFLVAGMGAFCILSRAGEMLVREEGTLTERGKTVRAEVPLHDSLGHIKECSWESGKLVSCTLKTRREPTAATYALALFESVLADADPAPYLAESLAEKAGALKEYLGAFVSVVLCEEPTEVGLVYQRTENVFDVRYFRVTIENGKIANIASID